MDQVQVDARITVVGPEGSSWVGQTGRVLRIEKDFVVVIMDGQPDRPRAFRPEQLKQEG